MAIVQISQIQMRRGLQQDLPQLASAELGWSIDTRRLFIGNGTLSEGAPNEGLTEILTEYSDVFQFAGSYTFKGLAAGVQAQTGPSSIAPILRSIQDKLDDYVSVRDFGAVGDGLTDDSGAINRAISQLYYVPNPSASNPIVRRTIHFPAGNYVIDSTILLPPYVQLIGDGRNNTVITCADATVTMMRTVDNALSGISLSNTTPRDIFVGKLKLQNTGTSLNKTLLQIDSAYNVRIEDVTFTSNVNNTTNNLVYVTDSVRSSNNIVFEACSFDNAGWGVNVTVAGSGINGVRVNNSEFTTITNTGINTVGSPTGVISAMNQFASVGTNSSPIVSVVPDPGTVPYSVSMSSGTNIITSVASGSGKINYKISDSSNHYRAGTFAYTYTGSAMTFSDEYTESATGVGATLTANNAGYVTCQVSTSTTFTYNIQ